MYLFTYLLSLLLHIKFLQYIGFLSMQHQQISTDTLVTSTISPASVAPGGALADPSSPNSSSFVAYYRVSTKKQGKSGLGLDAQKRDVEHYAKGKGVILAEYIEVESGKKKNRIELHKAIAHAKSEGAILVVAKLDRLSRDAAFTIELSNSDVNFVCVDNPHITKMTIGILALVNQDEAERISKRTKAALQEKKKRIGEGNILSVKVDASGKQTLLKPDKHGRYRLGSPLGFTDAIRSKGHEANKQKALDNELAKRAKQYIKDTLKDNPAASLSFLAQRLNAYGMKTPTGKDFTRFHVAYLRKLVLTEIESL